MQNLCYNCFSVRTEYDVCPYCGYVHVENSEDAYKLRAGAQIWGRYLIGTVLGMGGFGITYRAWDLRLSSMVAIKEFFPQSMVSRIPGELQVRVFSGDKQQSYRDHLTKFMDEAKNLAKFTGDAHIVNVLDFFEDNGTAYIVMEFLDGITLKQYLANAGGKLSSEQAIKFEIELLEALSSIHSKGIIHRDISPDNIFILKDERLKVLDFGAARFALEEGSDLSQSVVVKKGYAPPEQYRKNMKQGRWTDIYAAGATLYKMLTGITPDESIERVERDLLKRPSHTGALQDAAVDKAVMKSMALKPELRFKSAEMMISALQNKTTFDFPEQELKKRNRRNIFIVLGSVAALLAVALLLLPSTAEQIAVDGGTEGGIAELFTPDINVDFNDTPPLDIDSIEPCEITYGLFMPWGDEDKMWNELEAGFEAAYPGFDLVVHRYEQYEEGEVEDVAAEEAFREATYTINTRHNLDYLYYDLDEVEPVDITALYKLLDFDDYLILEEASEYILEYYYHRNENYKEDGDEKRYDGIYTIPIELRIPNIAYSSDLFAELGIEIPSQLNYDEFIALAKAHPGSFSLEHYDVATFLGESKPQIYENEDMDTLKIYLSDYINMYENNILNNSYNYNTVAQYDNSQNNHYLLTDGIADSIMPTVRDDGSYAYDTFNYEISGKVDENEQKAGMLFLYYLLSEEGQRIMHVDNMNSLPINIAAMEDYVAKHPYYSFAITDEYKSNLQFMENELDYIGYNLSDHFNSGSVNADAVFRTLEEELDYWTD